MNIFISLRSIRFAAGISVRKIPLRNWLSSAVLLAMCVYILTPAARAVESGSINTPVDDRAWIEFWEKATNTRYPKHDPNYRAGRDIYQGKGPHKNYRYCLASEPKAKRVKLSRKNLKSYRGMPVKEFVKVLYDCDDPQVQVLTKLSKEDAGLVVYYLHKRYKLRLKQEQPAEPAELPKVVPEPAPSPAPAERGANEAR